MKKHSYLLVIILLGLLIRARIILIADLWLDEAFSINLAKLSVTELMFSFGKYWDFIHPPFYYLVLKIWLYFNDGVIWLKSLGLLFYISSSLLLYKTTNQLFSRSIAVLTILFYAINPFIVNLDIQVRMYGLLSFCLIASQYLFFTNILNKEKLQFIKILLIALVFSICFFIDYGAIWFFIPATIFTFLTKNETYL